jgi:MAF protein
MTRKSFSASLGVLILVLGSFLAAALAHAQAGPSAALKPLDDDLAVRIKAGLVIAAGGDGDVLGKPRDEREAVEMLQRLSGREHEVFTGVAVATDGHVESDLERVRVRFRSLDRRACEEYVATGESLDKAGAYAIQGYGSALVEAIRGDYFAVMGLPVVCTLKLIQRFGWRYAFGRLEAVA